MRLTCCLAALLFVPTTANAQSVVLDTPFPNLTFSSPVDLQHPADGSNLLFVVEQAGVVKVFENDSTTTSAATFLDITDRVVFGGEQGLLGLAFDPDYAANGYVYLNYTVSQLRRQRVSRFTRTSAQEADPGSEEILYEGDPALAGFSNHNAGAIAFGPPEGPSGERYLYVTHGDGGSGGDPGENGQDLTTLLGSIVRLDVTGGGQPLDCADAGAATVPADNPFLDGPGGQACDEIYAYGLRNPFRMSFDPADDYVLWVGDVGQGTWEEIDLVTAGGNYGWDVMEGFHCFEPPSGCDQTGLTLPLFEYSHAQGACSITGGYVYRGAAIPELAGKYVYGDYCNGAIWALTYDGTTAESEMIERIESGGLSSFGVDADGELYAVDIGGTIYRLTPAPPVGVEEAPGAALSLTLVGPNPAHDHTTLHLAADGPARLTLYDAVGRRVGLLFDGRLPAGGLRADVPTAGLPAGVYLARLEAGGRIQTLTFTVAH